jgi:hypothetical protein
MEGEHVNEISATREEGITSLRGELRKMNQARKQLKRII